MNAEALFLPHLFSLHAKFPRLRIVLEHATTRAAIEAVKLCGPAVACTITAHHLALTVDDWAGQSWNYCKPVAKLPDDRQALQQVIKEGTVDMSSENTHQLLGHPQFFLGSDSAPHPCCMKSTSTPSQGCAAGIYTSPILLPLVAHLLDSFGAVDHLENFVSVHGRRFYQRQITSQAPRVALQKVGQKIVPEFSLHGETVVPFWAGKEICWSIV